MVDKKLFAERFKELRQSRNLTQKQIADIIGSVHQTVNNWEKCLALPSLDTAHKLAEFYDCSIDYLVGRTQNPDSHKC